MRMALAQAIHHARHRAVFQKHLVDQPMMRVVLADMALEVEAATALTLRLARSFDLAEVDPREAARARLLTPAVRKWGCAASARVTCEGVEGRGGDGPPRGTPCSRARGSGRATARCMERAASLPTKRAGSWTVPCRRLE